MTFRTSSQRSSSAGFDWRWILTRWGLGFSFVTAVTACMTTLPDDPPPDPDRPGFILGLVEDGELEVLGMEGAADIEQARPITPDTVFHIASLSKQITAAALAHAILDGHVALDDPVSAHIPEAAKYGDVLTVAHLVYMTSGLTEYTDVSRRNGRPWVTFHYFTVEEALQASLSVDELKFEPGSAWEYSNINYMLIAEIVEAAYGRPFSDVVRERVFEPLGMDASIIHDDVTRIIPDRANAYVARVPDTLRHLREGGGIQARDGEGLVMIRRNAPHYGGSGVHASMADWSLWMSEMMTRDRFGDAFWNLMLSTRAFDHDKSNDALGLVHGRSGEFDTLWYSGGDIDASTYMVVLPSREIAIACFANDPSDSCEAKVRNALHDRLTP